jgi:two-component system, cell cycle response regulator
VTDTSRKTTVTAPSKLSDRQLTEEACLIVIYGPDLGRRINLNRPQFIIGRSSKADIRIDQEAVSRNHCKIINPGNAILLRDLGSKNGTYVNDAMIDEYVLRDGDLIMVGHCIFKFLSRNNIENAYHEEIYRLGTVDGLTQVFNKRYFIESLKREIERALRNRRDLSLLMLGIDRFKDVNDSFGTLAGDHVLRHLASLIKARIRPEDILARYDGDKFAITFPEIDHYNAMQFSEKLRKLVEMAEFKFEDAVIPVTISIGIGSLDEERKDEQKLLEQASTNLLAAKEGGRNRIVGGTEAKMLLPHPRIKPMLAFREAIIRTCPPHAVLLGLKISNSSLLHQKNRDEWQAAKRRMENVIFATLGEAELLVGRADEQVLLLVMKDREAADKAQAAITAELANEEASGAPRLGVVFGPSVDIGADLATSISRAIDFMPFDHAPDWTQQLALPLGILARNLFLAREGSHRTRILMTLHEGITRWLLLWLWSEQCKLEQIEHERSRDEKYVDIFRRSIKIEDALTLLHTTVKETAVIVHHLHSHHAWQRLFASELSTLTLLNDFIEFREGREARTSRAALATHDNDLRRWEDSLLQILKEMTLIALPIVPGRNESSVRSRFEGSAKLLVGANPIVATEILNLSSPVRQDQLYLFTPSSSPILVEPFAVYARCHDCNNEEIFIADSIKDDKYKYWSPTTGHSLIGRTVADKKTWDNAPQTHRQLLAPPDILLITALEEERNAVLAHLTHEILPKSDDDVGIFYRAEIMTRANKRVRVLVTMLQGMGPLQASTRAMYAAMRWRPRHVLMIGIAGGVSTTTALGDVIIANQVADYTVGKITAKGTRNIFWHVHPAHASLLEAANAFATGWQAEIRVPRPEAGTPQRHIGVIASGGDVVSYKTLMQRYAESWPKLIGVEMEGGGIATALHQSPCHAGFLMIRGVSDFADAKKNSARVKKWRSYAASTAAAYTIELIKSGLVLTGA